MKAKNTILDLADTNEWAKLFKVLGDSVRLDVLREIVENPGISEKAIIINLKITQPTASFHLKQLMDANIVEFVKDGQTHCYYVCKKYASYLQNNLLPVYNYAYKLSIEAKHS